MTVGVNEVTGQVAAEKIGSGSVFKWIMRSQWAADITLLLIALVWGSTYVVIKDVVRDVPVFLFLFMRFGVTAVLLLPFVIRRLHKTSRKLWLHGFILGVTLFAVYSFETEGLVRTSASNAAFIISLYVVFVSIIELVAARRMPSKGLLAAQGLSIFGAILLILKSGYTVHFGDLFMLGAALCYAIQLTLLNRFTRGSENDSAVLTTIQLGVVALCCGVASFSAGDRWVHLTLNFWLAIAYLAIFATMIAFYVLTRLAQRTTPTRVAFLMSSEPVFATIMAILLLGEHLSMTSAIGGIMMLTGILLGRRSQ